MAATNIPRATTNTGIATGQRLQLFLDSEPEVRKQPPRKRLALDGS